MSGQILDFDSAWFGLRIGRYDGDPSAADKWAKKNALDCVYTLLPLDKLAVTADAVQAGFRVTDVRVEFVARTELLIGSPRSATKDDGDAIKGIALKAFRKTRFHNDHHFDRDRVNAMYANWALTTPGEVLVSEDVVGVVGFAVVGETHLELIAVNEDYRGHGYGLDLAKSTLGIANARGKRDLRVVTQGGNQAAQRTFQRAGFKLDNTSLWLHKWYDYPPPPPEPEVSLPPGTLY